MWNLLVMLTSASSALTVSLDVHGFSVSERGFVALLAERSTPAVAHMRRMIPLLVNTIDCETASSAESLTLLQLLQGIDLGGVKLPPELLQRRVAEATSTAGSPVPVLRHVLVSSEDSFSLCTSDGLEIDCESAFEAFAMALRYAKPIETDALLFDSLSLPLNECVSRYPLAYTRSDAAAQRSDITRKLTGVTCEPPAPRSAAACKELDVAAVDPSAFVPPPPVHGSKGAVAMAPALNANGAPPGLLEKALALAKAKGDLAAVEKIQAALKICE